MTKYAVQVRDIHTFSVEVNADDPSSAIEATLALLTQEAEAGIKREPDDIAYDDIENWDVTEVVECHAPSAT